MEIAIPKNSYFKNYQQDAEGFWKRGDTGAIIGHEEECKETSDALSELFSVFSEIDLDKN